jgi:excisionase family DNA binding protein
MSEVGASRQPAGRIVLNGDALLSIREVAAIFRRTDRTIRNYVRSGHLHPLRIGRSVFFRRIDVEELLNFGSSKESHCEFSEVNDSS